MASSPPPPPWTSPPASNSSRLSLILSSRSLSTFVLHDPIVRFTVARRVPRSSPRDPPPSTEQFVIQEEGFKESRHVLQRSDDTTSVVKEEEATETLVRLSRRQRARIRRDSFKRRPLWKRIVFASKKVRSIILLNVVTVIYASDIPVLKEVEQIVDPALFTVVRFSLTAVPFLPFMLREHEDSQTRTAGLELGFWVSLGYLSQALGLLTSDAGRASFISAFTIIVVPLIDGIFGATVPALNWYGALISLVGVAMLEYGGSLCVGDILNLLSAVFFGIHILRTEQISRNTMRTKFLALLGYEVLVVAMSSAIWFISQKYFLNGERLSFGSYSWSEYQDWIVSFPWIPAMYTGIFSTGLCLLAEMDALCNVSATETAIIYGLEPVWGAAFAWFLLGERWGTSSWIGAALVICGSLTVQLFGSYNKDDSNTDLADEKKDLALSTVTVKPRKHDSHPLKK